MSHKFLSFLKHIDKGNDELPELFRGVCFQGLNRGDPRCLSRVWGSRHFLRTNLSTLYSLKAMTFLNRLSILLIINQLLI